MLRRVENAVVYAAGTLTCGAGLAVMAGWLLKWREVVQIVPGFVPVQFNTALGFVLGGACLICSARRYRKMAALLAGLLLAFASAIGLQYILGLDFGIDQFFVKPFTQARTAFPGRMAPNTALCNVLFALALLYWNLGTRPLARFNLLTFAGVTLVLVSAIVLAGYLAHVEAAYSWWGLSDMAPQTAVGLGVLGTGALCLVHALTGRLDDARMRLWLPAYATLGGVILTVLIAQGLLLHNKQVAQEAVVQETRRIAGLVKLEMRVLAAVEHMRDRWDFAGGDIAAWRHDAARLVRNYTSYKSMALLGEDFSVVAAVPEQAASFWQGIAPDAGGIDAERGGNIYAEWTRPDYLYIYTRLETPGGAARYIAAAYDIRAVMAALIAEYQNKGFTYALSDKEGRDVYASPGAEGGTAAWTVQHSQGFETRGLAWQVRVFLDVAASQRNSLVLLVVIFGAVLSVLLAGALHQGARIRQYKTRLESVLEQLGDGLVMADVTGTIETSNLAAERLFRAGENGMKGTPLRGIAAPEKSEAMERAIAAALARRDGEPVVVETEGCDAQGRIFPMEVSLARVEIGKEVLMTAIIRDITERNRRDMELRQSNVELEQFAYIASHDLKAPLRGIDNLAHWIAEDLAPVLNDDAREKFTLLHSRVGRLETLLEDILRYSRAGRLIGEAESVDTAELLRQLTEPLALDGRFRFAMKGAFPVLYTQRTPLEQVFSNLIINAVKHHHKNAGVITISVSDRGLFYEFAVADDGEGIPEAFRERVFQMFQTLQPRDRKEGSGLGMAIVRKLVEWQGGRCWIETPPEGQGVAIHFLWRKAPAEPGDKRH
ncbi:MAG TPA: ATP-binding protein [Patescibacteria group bacterium]|nr:ATP-binding protein [Patescibacteria group bacterium]